MGTPKKISSTVNLNVIAAIDQSSGEILPPEELESRARLFLSEIRTVQEELIKANISPLPSRENAKFGSKWARENVISTTIADKILAPYIETYWTLNGCKSEAARIILAHRRRQDVWDALSALGKDESFEKVRELLNVKWLDYRLYSNVKKSGSPPRVPKLVGVKFPYCQMNKQVAQQKTFLDGVIIHNLAMGKNRYDIIFEHQNIFERYPDIDTLSRPTLSLTKNNEIKWQFSVNQTVEQRSPYGYSSVVAFDRNMDHSRIISGVRANRNGHVSEELGPSLPTVRAAEHAERVKTDLSRKKKKLANTMPWDMESDKSKRLVDDIGEVGEALGRLHDALDVMSVNDMIGHLRVGDLLVVERLDMFGGGFVKFRHGRSDERLEHKCARLGVPLLQVNPAGTTSSCPHCGGKLSFESDRVVECSECGFIDDRDCASSPIIAGRGLDKSAKRKRYERKVARQALDARERAVRSARKKAKREAKIERRRACGKLARDVGCVSSPKRSVDGVREGVSSQEASLGRVRALLDGKRREFGQRVGGSDGVSNDCIAGFYRIHGLGSWATNTLCFEYGLSDMRRSFSVILSEDSSTDKNDLYQLLSKKNK